MMSYEKVVKRKVDMNMLCLCAAFLFIVPTTMKRKALVFENNSILLWVLYLHRKRGRKVACKEEQCKGLLQ